MIAAQPFDCSSATAEAFPWSGRDENMKAPWRASRFETGDCSKPQRGDAIPAQGVALGYEPVELRALKGRSVDGGTTPPINCPGERAYERIAPPHGRSHPRPAEREEAP